MSRRRLILVAAAFAALLLCVALAVRVSQKTAASSGAANVQSAAYTQKEVPVFRETLTDEKVTLRFYEKTPSVAYIGLADYYKLMLPQGSMDVERRDVARIS